ncbi:MAG: type III pantothenate kinase [Chitinophagales bacterium]
MNLIIEIGNTNAKLALFEKNELQEKIVLPADSAEIIQKMETLRYDKALLAGSGAISSELWASIREPRFRFDRSMISDLEMVYQTPHLLGEDRLVNAYYAQKLNPECDNLVIDCGTCLTFTMIDSERRLIGGSISPGLNMRLKSMHLLTNALPDLTEKRATIESKLIGTSTDESLLSGAIFGMLYEIEGRIEAYSRQYPKLNVRLTGGDSTYIVAEMLKENENNDKLKVFCAKNEIFADVNFTLKGFNYILNLL